MIECVIERSEPDVFETSYSRLYGYVELKLDCERSSLPLEREVEF